MSIQGPHAYEADQQRGQRILSIELRRGAALLGAIGIALLMLVSIVLAMSNYGTFHATAEQITQGTSVSGGYTDTLAADGTYRVVGEEYVSDEARTFGDDPGDFTSYAAYTDVIHLTPYTMPSEGGVIYRIGIYVFWASDTQIRLALYEDTEGVPRQLLAQSEPVTVTDVITPAGWLWFDIEPQLIREDIRYWLAYQADNNETQLGQMSSPDGYRFRGWSWGPYPILAGTTWGPMTSRTCYQIAYTATQYALDVAYTVPVTPMMDAYTLTVRGTTSGEPFSVTADGQAVGVISYAPTTQDIFFDDMENGEGDWTDNGFTLIVTDSGHSSSPTHTWWTDDVPYSSSASLTSVPITLPFNARDMELQFWHRIVSEFTYDGGWLEYRIQEENGTWPAWSVVTWTMFFEGGYNEALHPAVIPSGAEQGWSGTITDTVRVRIPATAAGSPIQFRWVFECDSIGGEHPSEPDGWWIDDVRVLAIAPEDTELVLSLPPSLTDDGQVTVRFQDTITDSYSDLLGIDLIEINGVVYDGPIALTVTLPSGGEYWSGTQTIEWSGSNTNEDVVTYNVHLSTDGGASWSSSLHEVGYSETETQTTHVWSGFDTTAFTDSSDCLVRIEASDGGLSASDQSEAAFTIDNTDPSVSLTAPNGGEALQGGASYTITWSASDSHFGSTPIALHYSTDGGMTFPNEITSATQNDGAFLWSVPSIDADDVRVLVTATDLAGNTSEDESDADFTVDATAPDTSITAQPSDPDNDPTPTFQFSGSDPGGSGVASYECQVDSGGWSGCTSPHTTASLGDGSHTFEVRATDNAGNTDPTPASYTWTVDTAAPTIENETPAYGSTVTTGTPVISATLADALSGIDDTSITMTIDGNTVAYDYDAGSGTVSYTPSSALTNASHVVVISAQDRAGSPASSTWSFSVDEPPASVSLTANPTRVVADGVSTATITATVLSNSGHPVADGTQVVFTTTMGTLGSQSTYTTTVQGGVATAVLTAPEIEGTAVVTARAGEEVGTIEISLFLYRVYLPVAIKLAP
jgi:hypothetical protein